MRLLFACFGLLFVCGLISQTACMTNQEFVDLMIDSATDVEESYPGDVGYGDKDDGAIELPGGPEDELDLEYLMIQTSLPEKMMTQLNSLSHSFPETNLGSCNCQSKTCHCCLSHTFRVNLIFKRVTFTLSACGYVTYLPGEGIDIRFTINGRDLYHRQISTRHPPGLCFGVPGLSTFARVCLKFYNVDFSNRAFCLKIEGHLNLVLKKFTVNFDIGCFRLGSLNKNELRSLMSDSEALMAYLTSGDPNIEATWHFDPTKTHSLRELLQHAEINEIAENDESMEIV